MAKAIVFENGTVLSATIVDKTSRVCKTNLKDFVACPSEVLKCIDKDIIEGCTKTKEIMYLYIDGNDQIVISKEDGAV